MPTKSKLAVPFENKFGRERGDFLGFIVGWGNQNDESLLLQNVLAYIKENISSWKDKELLSFVSGMWDTENEQPNEDFSLRAIKKFLLNSRSKKRAPDGSRSLDFFDDLAPVAKKKMASFLPRILLNMIQKSSINGDGKRPVQCSSFYFNVYVLLVDISGFTRLSGSFCEKGKAGIDDLQKATNGYLGQLVQVIYNHGGDIIKFGKCLYNCSFKDVFYTLYFFFFFF